MAVAITGTPNVQSNTVSATNKTLTFTSDTYGAGEVIVVVACQNADSVFPVPGTPSGGGLSWTEIIDQQGTAGNFARTTAWWAPTGAGGTYSVTQTTTITSGNLSTRGVLYRLTGANTTTAFGATDGHQGNAADPLTGNTNLQLTTATAGSMLFAAATDWSASTITVDLDSGLTDTTDINATEAGQATFIAFRSDALGADDSDVRASMDAAGGTGNWAAIFFEIEASGGPAGPEAIVKVADRGSTQNITGEGSTAVDLAAGASITTGNYLIARVAVDNSQTSPAGAKPGLTVTDARNTWTVLDPANSLADPGAANAGSACYVAYARAVTAYSNGDDVTFTWGVNPTTAKAIVVEEWSGINLTAPVVRSVGANGTASPADITITPNTTGQLVYTCLSTEGPTGDTAPVDSTPTNGTWVTLTRLSTGSGTAAANQTVAGQYNVTATGGVANQWNPTITNRDWAAIAVVFALKEPPPSVKRPQSPRRHIRIDANFH